MKQKIIEIASVTGAVGGSSLIAMNLGYNQLGYMFFIVSSLSSLYLLRNSNASKALLITNAYFLIINIVGVIRY